MMQQAINNHSKIIFSSARQQREMRKFKFKSSSDLFSSQKKFLLLDDAENKP